MKESAAPSLYNSSIPIHFPFDSLPFPSIRLDSFARSLNSFIMGQNKKEDDDFAFLKAFPKGFSNTTQPKSALDQDCDRPACDDTMAALSAALKQAQLAKNNTKNNPQSSSSSSSQAVAASTTVCPPTKSALGSSSWDLLHSMVAWYPDHPSPKDQTMMTQFFDSFARFYPCTYCAEDFQANLKQQPVETASRENLCVWLCQQHNLVNEKLGKPLFPCEIQRLDERWRKSKDPKCQP